MIGGVHRIRTGGLQMVYFVHKLFTPHPNTNLVSKTYDCYISELICGRAFSTAIFLQ